MEACATSHHWARELTKLGHEVRLMPAKDVKAYVKRNKDDAADAETSCEAVRRATMRFVRIKTAEQQMTSPLGTPISSPSRLSTLQIIDIGEKPDCDPTPENRARTHQAAVRRGKLN
jgi:hypothetical protein